MRCHIEHSFQTDSYRIWLYTRIGESGARVLQLVPPPEGERPPFHQWVREVEAAGGAEVPPTIELPRDALEAIVAKASDHLPPSAAAERHLGDAITMRDRMTALVEYLVRDAARRPEPPDPPGFGSAERAGSAVEHKSGPRPLR